MMRGSLLLLLLLLSLSCFCCYLSQARHHPHKHPSALIIGAVYCDTCFQDPVSKASHYISGATVAVECAEGKERRAFYKEVKTDKQGSFRVELPFRVKKDESEIKGCTVKLLKSSESYCAVASTATSSLIQLKEKQHGKHIYSAGFFTFKPLKQPGLCNQQPSLTKINPDSLSLGTIGITLPALPILPLPQIPAIPLPETPTLPLPGTPPLPITNPLTPTIPGSPLLPNLPLPPLPPLPPFSKGDGGKLQNGLVSLFPPLIPPVIAPPSSGLPFPNPLSPPALLPNPLQPPPSPLIPNPLQPPTPPPGLLPPIPNIPGIPAIPAVPAIPGIIPSPPPPPPPSLFPPIFPPGLGVPGIGIPPAMVDNQGNHP